MSRFLFILSLFLLANVSAEPWGKDADLALNLRKKVTCENRVKTNPFVQFGINAIRFHQEVISPADGPRSHFIPSSSQYTLEAMRKHGFFQGYILGCDRLLRENDEDWVYRKIKAPNGYLMKWNPVP
jgi:putative component of membrane protein insertase Oxa1/YidC/SpoIIIJ protein YidD